MNEKLPLSKRSYTRLKTNLKIRYRTVGGPSKSLRQLIQPSRDETVLEESTSTKDISASGVLFYLDKSLSLGTILRITMEIPTDEDEPIECLSRVERIDEIMPDKVYGIGTRFMDMSYTDRARIERYIKYNS